MSLLTVLTGDCLQVLKTLPEESVQCCVTSPPYWGLRDYGHPDQIGNEPHPQEFAAKLVAVFSEVRRVLKPDGTLWMNLGDTYAANRGGTTPPAQTVAGGVNGKGGEKERRGQSEGYNATRNCKAYGLKHKDLVGIPWRVAFALQSDGWYLRSDIIWHKPNPMPESVTDRPTKSHEYIFLLTKSERYYYDHEAIKEQSVSDHMPGNTTHKGLDAYNGGSTEHRTKAGLVEYAKRKRESAKRGEFNGKREAMADTGQNSFRAVVDMRNKRTVWTVPVKPYSEAHFATYPPDLIKPCILAGTKPGDVVLDPFGGSGTTGQVALELGRGAVLIELNPEYVKLIDGRTNVTPGLAL